MLKVAFAWSDYVVFSILLLISLLIGVYFGFFSKQDTANEYLYGGKNMGYFPVAVSLLSSFLSGVMFLGLPAEVYLYGAAYTTAVFGAVITAILTIYVFLPIFFKLQLSSTNEYLELRFSSQVRKLSSLTYLIGLVSYTSIIIYVPALAFSQVTGYTIHTITPILTIICITYTSMGGVKAVIWTDTFQFMFTLIGVFAILGFGLNSVSGFSEVWRLSSEGGRLHIFDMSPSMFKRNTFWAIQTSLITSCVSRFSVGQKFVQKFLSVRAIGEAKKAIWIMIGGWIMMILMCSLIGLAMYTKYHDCDPSKAGFVDRSDQNVVYFVMNVAGFIPGLPGIFLAGLVSCSLSTMSACLNTLGGMIYDDIIRNWIPASSNQEAKAANIMKVSVIIVGMVSIGLVFIMEKLGTIYNMIFVIGSILDAPVLCLFLMGMLMPWVGKKGALVGGYTSLIFAIWQVGVSQWHVINKRIHFEHLPTSTKGCPYPLNETINTTTPLPPLNPEDEPFFIFRISVLYFTFTASLVGIVVGIITSYVTNEIDLASLNPDYISPLLHRFLPEKKYIEVPLKNMHTSNNIEKIDVSLS